ncbi:hypothetical protein TIFTF001_020188 [Ficus carica]|uniref:Uncharacterized protein n=1 Tax=Ficus carica TaxID=3494 RepID=A0AA88ATR9_FICCA|nr:hypothetical protein TIFTF001_020188 [Ficus carica]
MSLRLNPNLGPLRPGPATSRDRSRETSHSRTFLQLCSKVSSLSSGSELVCSRKFERIGGGNWTISAPAPPNASNQQQGSAPELDESPVSVELSPVSSEAHFDRLVAQAQQLEESLVFVW